MADGGSFATNYLPAFSHLLGETESPTQTQSMMSPQFGGSPEQLMGILQHPQTQALLGQLGIHFDPSKMRQSPFLPNSFMQGHPLLGGALNQGMANMAATPEAPLVSGAGSGLTRATQGMMGGPELLRQHQVKQMLSPMQAMGSMIPGQEFQRKQQLLQLLQKMEEDRAAQSRQHEQYVEGSPSQKLQNQIYAPAGAPSYFTMGQAQPAGGPQGLDLQQQGPSRGSMPGLGPLAGQNVGLPPGSGLAPAQQAGPVEHPWDTQRVADMAAAKEAPGLKAQREGAGARSQAEADFRKALKDANVPDAEAELLTQRAFEAKSKGNEAQAKGDAAKTAGPKGGWTQKGAAGIEEKKASAQNAILKEYAPIREKYGSDKEWQQKDPNSYGNFMQRMQQLEDQYTEAGRASGGQYSGYTYPGMHSSVPPQNPFLAPGASQGAAQAGGPGSNRSEGTATAPQNNGLPPGYTFNEQGIPVPAQSQQQQPRQ